MRHGSFTGHRTEEKTGIAVLKVPRQPRHRHDRSTLSGENEPPQSYEQRKSRWISRSSTPSVMNLMRHSGPRFSVLCRICHHESRTGEQEKHPGEQEFSTTDCHAGTGSRDSE